MGERDNQCVGYTMTETHSFRERALVSEGEDVESVAHCSVNCAEADNFLC